MTERIKSFEDLKCWKEARELRLSIMELIKIWPPEEKFRLVDQIIRAVRSITNNIAEGYGRFHFQENTQFCRQARGSLYEVRDHLIIALEQKYIDNKSFEELSLKITRTAALLNGYINYLQKAKKNI